MAFLETEQLSICKILGINKLKLTAQLIFYGPDVTLAIENGVRAEITRWEGGVGDKFVSVEANSANFGAKIDPDLAKADVRANISSLLFFDQSDIGAGVSETFEIERG